MYIALLVWVSSDHPVMCITAFISPCAGCRAQLHHCVWQLQVRRGASAREV